MSGNWFEFNNVRSDSMGLLIAEKNVYGAPQRDIELVHVPGRNGDVLIDHGGWNNVDVSYTVQFLGLPTKAPLLRQWLQATDYHILRDSYQPDYFRYGVFSSVLNPEELAWNVGRLQVVFSCKPFLYRTSDSLTTVTLSTSGSTIINPEAYGSQPYIRINGSGGVTLYITNNGVQRAYVISDLVDYVEIDSELMSAYRGSVLCNNKILFTSFPTLEPGVNTISWTNNVTSVEIIPRWRRI